MMVRANWSRDKWGSTVHGKLFWQLLCLETWPQDWRSEINPIQTSVWYIIISSSSSLMVKNTPLNYLIFTRYIIYLKGSWIYKQVIHFLKTFILLTRQTYVQSSFLITSGNKMLPMKAEENSDTKCTLYELDIILNSHRISLSWGHWKQRK